MSAEPIDPLTELPAPLVRMLAIKVDPYSNTKPLDDFFRALMRHHDFCMKQKAAEASQQSRAQTSPMTMNVETQNALTITTNNPVAVADGWDAQANDSAASPMKGSSIKFDNGAYFIGREKTLIQPDRQFVAIDVREGWLFLKNGCS